jgi:hypothetical protein
MNTRLHSDVTSRIRELEAEVASLTERLAYQVKLNNARYLALLDVRDSTELSASIIDSHFLAFCASANA